jgi:hypothetical protein
MQKWDVQRAGDVACLELRFAADIDVHVAFGAG